VAGVTWKLAGFGTLSETWSESKVLVALAVRKGKARCAHANSNQASRVEWNKLWDCIANNGLYGGIGGGSGGGGSAWRKVSGSYPNSIPLLVHFSKVNSLGDVANPTINCLLSTTPNYRKKMLWYLEKSWFCTPLCREFPEKRHLRPTGTSNFACEERLKLGNIDIIHGKNDFVA